jgi:hypothetical protein
LPARSAPSGERAGGFDSISEYVWQAVRRAGSCRTLGIRPARTGGRRRPGPARKRSARVVVRSQYRPPRGSRRSGGHQGQTWRRVDMADPPLRVSRSSASWWGLRRCGASPDTLRVEGIRQQVRPSCSPIVGSPIVTDKGYGGPPTSRPLIGGISPSQARRRRLAVRVGAGAGLMLSGAVVAPVFGVHWWLVVGVIIMLAGGGLGAGEPARA